eukprot:scaffold1697_cov180-Amphora_coffeaeformis.AAC.6
MGSMSGKFENSGDIRTSLWGQKPGTTRLLTAPLDEEVLYTDAILKYIVELLGRDCKRNSKATPSSVLEMN